MATAKISQFNVAGQLTGQEALAGVQNGGNVKVTPEQLVEYFAVEQVTADPYADLVKALYHFEGTSGTATFIDEAALTTATPTNITLSDLQAKFGTTSARFNGTNTKLMFDSADFMLAGDFCLEFSVYGDFVGQCLFASVSGGAYFYNNAFQGYGGPSLSYPNATMTAFDHIAICRRGTTMMLFFNGELYSTAQYNGVVNLRQLQFGNYHPNNNLYFLGYLDELRLTVGAARYITNFTAPASAFSLTRSVSKNLLTSVNVFTKNQSVAPFILSDNPTIAIDASKSNNFVVTLGGNRTFGNPINLTDGMTICIVVKQDGTGNRLSTFGSKWIFDAGVVLKTAPFAIDYITAYYDAASDKLIGTLRGKPIIGSDLPKLRLNYQAGTSYPLELADSDGNTKILMTSASSNEIVIPLDVTLAVDVGRTILFTQMGAGTTVLVKEDPGIIIHTPFSSLQMRTRYSSGGITKLGPDEWLVFGDMQ